MMSGDCGYDRTAANKAGELLKETGYGQQPTQQPWPELSDDTWFHRYWHWVLATKSSRYIGGL